MTNKLTPAPTVIAKGAGLMGRRIRDAAGQHNVATVEEPSLARAVYRGVAVRHEKASGGH